MLAVSVSSDAAKNEQPMMAALAKVGKEVLTTRDLLINQFLNENDNPFSNYMEGSQPLKELVWEQMIYFESERVFSDKVSSGEIEKAMLAAKSKLKNDQLWTRLFVHQKELRQAVHRKLSSEKLLKLRLPPALIYISDAEVEVYYQKHKAELGGRPLAEVKDRLAKGLRVRKIQARFRDWIQAMSRNYPVSYYAGVKIK